MTATELIQQALRAHDVVAFTKSWCPHCKRAVSALQQLDVFHNEVIDDRADEAEIQDELKKLSGIRTVPQVFVKGKFFGDGSKTVAAITNGELQKLL
ncbi:MAG: hypothetical protein KVP17_004825 [Porospora cf. gigantea B]|uniref:uncharacterized protein n=1 Tax=Porospora cf. gigantea B TaxID=2853592 RepID=UPI003571D9CF|nr:MAG: hypothetical protein KVP17_004825 [Porospora cf. gigantea B]